MSGDDVGILHVLVVEDEPIAAEAHTAYVERVPGFTVAATVAHEPGGHAGPAGHGRSTWCSST